MRPALKRRRLPAFVPVRAVSAVPARESGSALIIITSVRGGCAVIGAASACDCARGAAAGADGAAHATIDATTSTTRRTGRIQPDLSITHTSALDIAMNRAIV